MNKGGITMPQIPLSNDELARIIEGYELARIIEDEIKTLNSHIKQAKEKGLRVEITTNSSALSADTPELSVEIYQRMEV